MRKKKSKSSFVDDCDLDQREPIRSSKMVAKKDFRISCNQDDITIQEGDDLSDIPKMYIQNLKTEGVL